jgi:GTP pyrophosphokinase
MILFRQGDVAVENERRVEKAFLQCGARRGRETAAIVSEMGLDADSIIAALLFASCENESGLQKIGADFGESVTALARSVAKVSRLSAKDRSAAEAEKIRKMLFAMIEDIRVVFICLAGKLRDMRAIADFPPEERRGIARECLDIYAPLAERVGVSRLKDELEDLCLKELNPAAFRQINSIVALKQSEREHFLDTVKSRVSAEAEKRGINIEVKSRAKHFYSIYQKMRKRNKEAGDLYDLFGLRLFCGSVEDCYALLGMIHGLWKPADGRFKDYIAMPKSNGYQSLHTTVLAFDDTGSGGNMLEIQIRTFDMHDTAEYGYASHWLYKKGAAGRTHEKELPLVNRLKRIALGFGASADVPTNVSVMAEIKKEMLKDSIFVFTPQGKVIELPQGATPIDFAYSIHTAIGEHCYAAKANGAIIPLGRPLQNTQIVEIVTAQNARPHEAWLHIARTSKARSKIRAWLAQNDEAVRHEKHSAAKKKQEEHERHNTPARSPAREKCADCNAPSRVLVQAERNMLFRFAKCCGPKPPDEIIGYVSRGRGIIIHRKDCAGLPHIAEFDQRRIDAEWDGEP